MTAQLLEHLLRSTSDDSGQTIIALVAGVGAMLLTWLFIDGYKKRAEAHDHVCEAPRDIVMPDHCADCGTPHPKYALRIYPTRPNASRYQAVADALADPRLKREYKFRFCERCARPIRRRRRLGFALRVATILVGLHFAGIFFIWPIAGMFDAMHPGAEKWFRSAFSLAWASPDIFLAFIIYFTGLFLSVHARAVKIIDTGGERLYFAFTNQVYRNHFAEMNGEVKRNAQ